MDIATYRFSGHQSFALRNTWLTKGVQACAQNPAIFRAPDALVTLGVGKNMVDAIKHWCLATQMVKESDSEHYTYVPTVTGRMLFVGEGAYDPYLEDDGTLWLTHWLLATCSSMATTIYYAFNLWAGLEFTRVGIENAITQMAEQKQVRATPNTIARDVGVFIRTYTGGAEGRSSSTEEALDSPLADLGLLHGEVDQQSYAFGRGPKDSLPDAIVLYALDGYWRLKGKPATLTFDELAYSPLSPGRVFKLDEPSLAERLERVSELTQGAWQLTETAGFRQVTIRSEMDSLGLLESYYMKHGSGAAHG